MGKRDIIDDAVERLEWDERKAEQTPYSRWRQLTRRTALTGGAAGIAAMVLEACGSSSSSSTSSAATGGGSGAAGIFGSSKSYKFTSVNHVTTNPFFTPTQNGAADACKLLGCSYQWTGSSTSNVGEMVNALNSAVSAGVDGIAVALSDLKAFNSPVAAALRSARTAGVLLTVIIGSTRATARARSVWKELASSTVPIGHSLSSA